MSYHDDELSSCSSATTPPYHAPYRASTQTTNSSSKVPSVTTPSKASRPLDNDHVGLLPDCINVLYTLEAILKKRIAQLSEFEGVEDINDLFRHPHTNSVSDISPLTDPASPWQQFHISELTAHKLYLQTTVLKWTDRCLNELSGLQQDYLREWRRDQALQIVPALQQILAQLAGLLEELMHLLSIKESRGLFRLGLEGECRTLMKDFMSLVSHVASTRARRVSFTRESMGKMLKQTKLSGGAAHFLKYTAPPLSNSNLSDWMTGMNDRVERSSKDEEEAIDQPLVDIVHSSDSIQAPSSLSRITYMTTSRLRSRRFWLAEMVVISVGLLVAVPWSVLKSDPQTGFTIGAFVVAAGTLLVAGGMKLNARQGCGEGEGGEKVMVD